LDSLLEDILTRNTSFSDFQVERAFPTIGSRIMHINARKLNGKDGREMMILLAIEDITERSQMANSFRGIGPSRDSTAAWAWRSPRCWWNCTAGR